MYVGCADDKNGDFGDNPQAALDRAWAEVSQDLTKESMDKLSQDTGISLTPDHASNTMTLTPDPTTLTPDHTAAAMTMTSDPTTANMPLTSEHSAAQAAAAAMTLTSDPTAGHINLAQGELPNDDELTKQIADSLLNQNPLSPTGSIGDDLGHDNLNDLASSLSANDLKNISQVLTGSLLNSALGVEGSGANSGGAATTLPLEVLSQQEALQRQVGLLQQQQQQTLATASQTQQPALTLGMGSFPLLHTSLDQPTLASAQGMLQAQASVATSIGQGHSNQGQGQTPVNINVNGQLVAPPDSKVSSAGVISSMAMNVGSQPGVAAQVSQAPGMVQGTMATQIPAMVQVTGTLDPSLQQMAATLPLMRPDQGMLAGAGATAPKQGLVTMAADNKTLQLPAGLLQNGFQPLAAAGALPVQQLPAAGVGLKLAYPLQTLIPAPGGVVTASLQPQGALTLASQPLPGGPPPVFTITSMGGHPAPNPPPQPHPTQH